MSAGSQLVDFSVGLSWVCSHWELAKANDLSFCDRLLFVGSFGWFSVVGDVLEYP